MAKAPRSTLKKFLLRPVLVLALGVAVFLTDNSHFTSASSFENRTLSESTHVNRLRLPASVAQQPVLAIDCKSTQEKIELHTDFETVRLNAVNCGSKIVFENTRFKNKLLTFPVDKQTYSSEFAYLAHGENTFTLTSGGKSFQLSVFRF